MHIIPIVLKAVLSTINMLYLKFVVPYNWLLQERRRLNASRATNRDDAEDQLPESTASRADSSSATFDPSSQEDSPPSTIHAVPVPPPHAPPSYSEAQAQISQAQDNPGAENTEMDMTPDSPPQPSSANPTAQVIQFCESMNILNSCGLTSFCSEHSTIVYAALHQAFW